MINPFVIKKYTALLMSGFISTILYLYGQISYGLLGGVGFMLVGILLSLLVGNILLRNPFTLMVEGKGILLLNIDSTGVLKPSVVNVVSPYIKGWLGRTPINDVFDRDTVLQLATPQTKGNSAMYKDGDLYLKINQKTYNEGRMALFHYPVLIWNDQIKSIITKDFLGETEKYSFAEHTVLYLNRKMEELTSAVRDFGRHVVELTKPVKGLFQNGWTWIIIVVVLIILAIMFGPAILGQASNVASGIGGGGAFTPK